MDKRKYNLRHAVVRVSYERDLDHPAWFDASIEPTLATHPDAFYRVVAPLMPCEAKAYAKGRPVRLSGRKLRRLLYHTGYRGEQIKVARERLREAAQRAAMHGGCTYQGVSRQDLPELVGPRAARRIVRATTRFMLIVDEYWQLASPGLAKLFRQARSLHTKWSPYAA
jgi:hypothetical protein